MYNEPHVGGFDNLNRVGKCGDVLQEVVDERQYGLLTRRQECGEFVELSQHCWVDSASVVKECSDDFLAAKELSGGEWRRGIISWREHVAGVKIIRRCVDGWGYGGAWECGNIKSL